MSERIVYDPTKDAQAQPQAEASKTQEKQKTKKTPKSRQEKPQPQPEPKKTSFPIEGKVNAYGFIYLDSDVQSAFGFVKGKEQKISIDMKDDALIIKKA